MNASDGPMPIALVSLVSARRPRQAANTRKEPRVLRRVGDPATLVPGRSLRAVRSRLWPTRHQARPPHYRKTDNDPVPLVVRADAHHVRQAPVADVAAHQRPHVRTVHDLIAVEVRPAPLPTPPRPEPNPQVCIERQTDER